MQVGDYILKENITDEETLNRIRDCVKKMGYGVSCLCGGWMTRPHRNSSKLRLDIAGDLIWCSVVTNGHEFTPQQIFAMVEEPSMKEDIKQTIQRMEQEIATLKEQLKNQEDVVDEPTYHRGQRFYIGDPRDEEYILACVGGKHNSWDFCLVEIESGDRYRASQKVKLWRNVTVDEMLTLTDGVPFQLIEK